MPIKKIVNTSNIDIDLLVNKTRIQTEVSTMKEINLDLSENKLSANVNNEEFNLDNISLGPTIALLGCISSGKSTLLNSLLCQQYSDMKKRKTTMIPQLYQQNTCDFTEREIKEIREKNQKVNNKFLDGVEFLTKDNCREIKHLVKKSNDFVNLPDGIDLSIYDIPGLNDSESKEIYYHWLQNNFKNLDIVIFIIDINDSINTSDEKDILEIIIKNIILNKRNNIETKLYILLNKCDQIDISTDTISPYDPEDKINYQQAIKIIEQVIHKHNCQINYKISPISAEDSFIYRMYLNFKNPDIETKYLDRIGQDSIGLKNWRRKSDSDKKKFIEEQITKETCLESIKYSGFDYFKDNISKLLDKDFILQIIKRKISNSFKIKHYKKSNYNHIQIIHSWFSQISEQLMTIDNLNNLIYQQFGVNNFYKNIINPKFGVFMENFCQKIHSLQNHSINEQLYYILVDHEKSIKIPENTNYNNWNFLRNIIKDVKSNIKSSIINHHLENIDLNTIQKCIESIKQFSDNFEKDLDKILDTYFNLEFPDSYFVTERSINYNDKRISDIFIDLQEKYNISSDLLLIHYLRWEELKISYHITNSYVKVNANLNPKNSYEYLYYLSIIFSQQVNIFNHNMILHNIFIKEYYPFLEISKYLERWIYDSPRKDRHWGKKIALECSGELTQFPMENIYIYYNECSINKLLKLYSQKYNFTNIFLENAMVEFSSVRYIF